MVTVQKLKTFQTDSPLKRFDFSPFGTAPSDSSLNLKRFTLPKGVLSSFHLSLEENGIWSYIWGADTFSS
jgi:hypothetical protein